MRADTTLSKKEMREYASKQQLRLQFDNDHHTVVARHRKYDDKVFSGPIYELEEKMRAGEAL